MIKDFGLLITDYGSSVKIAIRTDAYNLIGT